MAKVDLWPIHATIGRRSSDMRGVKVVSLYWPDCIRARHWMRQVTLQEFHRLMCVSREKKRCLFQNHNMLNDVASNSTSLQI